MSRAVAILLREPSSRILLVGAPSSDDWDLPWIWNESNQPLGSAQRELCRVHNLELTIEVHGVAQIQSTLASQSTQTTLIRASTTCGTQFKAGHQWLAISQLADFALGPLIRRLWQDKQL